MAAAWMMQHVYDHFDYSQDLAWFRSQGYPLIKGIAIYWLSQIMEDGYFNDGTLVINNCNSPEHGPTTFGCAHSQQLTIQVFSYVLEAAKVGVETDADFTDKIAAALAKMDTGIHIGTWGQLKEWKLPDSYGLEVKNDTHRHLSHLVGWHPGSSVSGLAGGYTNETIQNAVATALYSRGNGSASDADAGYVFPHLPIAIPLPINNAETPSLQAPS
jgi:alpha-L-fucosidase 2